MYQGFQKTYKIKRFKYRANYITQLYYFKISKVKNA